MTNKLLTLLSATSLVLHIVNILPTSSRRIGYAFSSTLTILSVQTSYLSRTFTSPCLFTGAGKLAKCPNNLSAVHPVKLSGKQSQIPVFPRWKDGCSLSNCDNQAKNRSAITYTSTTGIQCRKIHISSAKASVPNKVTMEAQDNNLFLNDLNTYSKVGFKHFIDSIDAVMFDCDGVIWLGMQPFKNAQETIAKLKKLGKKVFFITNNSTKTREEFLQKFSILNFATSIDEIVGTSYLAALYLKERHFSKKVYVVGTKGVTQELNKVGIETLPIGPDPVSPTSTLDSLVSVSLQPDVGAVVIGFDQHISYPKMFKAASYLKDPNCIFIATNTDENFPSANHCVLPGTGAIVNAVKTAAGREPVVMGKPSSYPYDFVNRAHNLDPNRVLMIGDRANTDILFGRNCGLRTLLVLSGVTTLNEVKGWHESGSEQEKLCVPHFYLKEIGDLLTLIEKYMP